MFKLILPLLFLILIGSAGTAITIFKISPCSSIDAYNICSNFASHALIFLGVSLLSTLTGLLGIIGLIIRRIRYGQDIFANHANVALRQGFLLSLILTISFILYITNYFRWWLGIFLLVIITIFEYFLSLGENR